MHVTDKCSIFIKEKSSFNWCFLFIFLDKRMELGISEYLITGIPTPGAQVQTSSHLS